ncbi:TPA: single-stranded DNA-binding protein [Klebsiella pneumoniae]
MSSNHFAADGNLGQAPKLETVTVDGQQRDVLNFSVYVERRIPDGNGGFEDKGGFWLPGSLWGRRAKLTHESLKKGMRVHVVGELRWEPWEQDGEQRSRMKLDAKAVYIDPISYARRDR